MIQAIQICLTQVKDGTHGLQFFRQSPELLPGILITGSDIDPSPQQGFDERGIGYPNADDGDSFPLKGVKILL